MAFGDRVGRTGVWYRSPARIYKIAPSRLDAPRISVVRSTALLRTKNVERRNAHLAMGRLRRGDIVPRPAWPRHAAEILGELPIGRDRRRVVARRLVDPVPVGGGPGGGNREVGGRKDGGSLRCLGAAVRPVCLRRLA